MHAFLLFELPYACIFHRQGNVEMSSSVGSTTFLKYFDWLVFIFKLYWDRSHSFL